jgi:hypothetical protein
VKQLTDIAHCHFCKGCGNAFFAVLRHNLCVCVCVCVCVCMYVCMRVCVCACVVYVGGFLTLPMNTRSYSSLFFSISSPSSSMTHTVLWSITYSGEQCLQPIGHGEKQIQTKKKKKNEYYVRFLTRAICGYMIFPL